jgi:hypothetical protein
LLTTNCMLQNWDGLLGLLVLIGPVLLAQNALHGELQALLLILTRSETATISIFSLLFIPGVLLHELSHFLMAKLLGVRTARFSVLPETLPGGKLQLGFVETERTGLLRDALIGLAPLLSGGLALAYLGLNRLALAPLGLTVASGEWPAFWAALRQIPNQSDFWVWFYLAFSVATTMLPSESDRRAWLPILLWALLLAGAAVLAGAGPWLLENLAPALNSGLRAAAIVFGISLWLHFLLWIPMRLLRAIAQHLTGVRLVSR